MSEHSTGCKGRFAPLAYTYSGETKDFGKKQKTHLVSPQPTCFYMTGYRVTTDVCIHQRGLIFDYLLRWSSINAFNYFVCIYTKMLIIYFKSSGRGNCLGFAPSSQNRALCALHKPARSVRYPDSLRSIRTSAPLVDETKLSLTREGPLQRKIRWSVALKRHNGMQGLH